MYLYYSIISIKVRVMDLHSDLLYLFKFVFFSIRKQFSTFILYCNNRHYYVPFKNQFEIMIAIIIFYVLLLIYNVVFQLIKY